MLNFVKLDSKPTKKCFRPYFLNDTSDQSKFTPKCSKINGKCRKSFKANKEMFSLIPWQRYIRTTQNIHKDYSKMKYKCCKTCFKADKETFSHLSGQWYVWLTQNKQQCAQNQWRMPSNLFQNELRNVFVRILSTIRPIIEKQSRKCSKINCKCSKTDFKACKKSFLPVSWQQYIVSTQNHH